MYDQTKQFETELLTGEREMPLDPEEVAEMEALDKAIEDEAIEEDLAMREEINNHKNDDLI